MTGSPRPKRELDEMQRAAWDAAYASAVKQGIWVPEFIFGLEMFARCAAAYVRMVQSGLSANDPDLIEYHRLTREQAFEWFLVDDPDPPPLRSDALDPDVARICGLPPQVLH